MSLHNFVQKSVLFIAAVLALPSLSFGSDATVCYQATQRIPSEVPSLLCLEGIHASAQTDQVKTLEIESHNGSMPKAVTITKLSRHNEDRYHFAAEAVIVDESVGYCARTVQATLKIAGESTVGSIDPSNLSVAVEVAYNPDTCNVGTFVDVIPYVRVGAIR